MAFARFVRRAIDDAREERGWTVTDLATHTGRGSLHRVPLAGRRLAGLPRAGQGSRLLRARSTCRWRPRSGRSACPTPARSPAAGADDAPVEADVRVILDRLADPSVPAEEKHHIRDLLRYLARRPIRRAG